MSFRYCLDQTRPLSWLLALARPALLSLMLVAPALPALAATYTFTGPLYGANAVAPYTANMRITGSFTTATPLPPNVVEMIGPSGSNQVTSWSFNDGINTFTKDNSYESHSFRVGTDANGNITDWLIRLLSPLPPNSNNQLMSGISLYTNDSGVIRNEACLQPVNGVCDGVRLTVFVELPGIWAQTDAPSAGTIASVPVLPLPLLALLSLGLGGLGVRRLTRRG